MVDKQGSKGSKANQVLDILLLLFLVVLLLCRCLPVYRAIFLKTIIFKMVYMHFPTQLTEDEELLQRKYVKLRKKVSILDDNMVNLENLFTNTVCKTFFQASRSSIFRFIRIFYI